VCSFEVASTEPRLEVGLVPRPQAGPEVRPPVAPNHAFPTNGFYPADPAQLDEVLDELLPAEREPETWPGAMVPHAGWQYSGRLAARVFSRLKIPERVIIVSPRHRPVGANWAVAPHRVWSLPGRDVESDPELAQRLADGVEGLELDAAAHAHEHAIEVQLPFLARLAPQARVVGIVLASGSADLDDLRRLADQLAGVLRDLPEWPLLVISTDMNHYASETHTRRVDRMALACIESCDPGRLYRTVTDNQISMCGMMPAVVVMETLRRLDSLNRCEQVGYTTSAEASGDTSRVVGYAGMLFA
jgi:AmmeMemoRadiSam system protein B